MGIYRRLVATVIMLASIAAITGCGGISVTDSIPYKYDTPLTQSLDEFHRQGPQGSERRMDGFTDFDWDKVYLFGEGSSYRSIDEIIGTPVFGRDGRYYDNDGVLLFFAKQGKVVNSVAFAPGYITGKAHTYARDTAMLRAYSKDPGPYQLELIDTGQSTP
ncbi:MAG: hypothetical protein ACRDRX_12175 [Pseudonocardiaceae bacterium]